jgi:rare lipoprotein A
MRSGLALILTVICLSVVFLGNCTHSLRYTRNKVKTRSSYRTKRAYKKKFIGMASYYGSRFHGKKTANGERFDMYDYTAAHRTLPFNTRVRVKNLENNKSIIVRINDRGPYVKERIIDLSFNAAKKIGLIGRGVVKVKITILP